MSGFKRGTTVFLVVLVTAACSARLPPTDVPIVPSAPPLTTVEALVRFGDPLDAGEVPDPEACEQVLRNERAAALAIRTEVRLPGIDATPVAVTTAADDPGASFEGLGIPLRPHEIAALEESGATLGDDQSPLAHWVHTGRPDLFGGVWIDQTWMVSIVGGAPDSLALARCLEQGRAVGYVTAAFSYLEGLARTEAISAQREALKAIGIEVHLVGYLENKGATMIRVTKLDGRIEDELRRRFGNDLQIEQGPPMQRL